MGLGGGVLGKREFRKFKVANKCLLASMDGQTDGQAQSNMPPQLRRGGVKKHAMNIICCLVYRLKAKTNIVEDKALVNSSSSVLNNRQKRL